MKKKWRVLLLAAALPLVLCGCMMSASVDDLYALPQLPEEYESLSAQLKETIILRETYPELTLSQLAEEFEPPITKSCLNHRLRKLVELSRA